MEECNGRGSLTRQRVSAMIWGYLGASVKVLGQAIEEEIESRSEEFRSGNPNGPSGIVGTNRDPE